MQQIVGHRFVVNIAQTDAAHLFASGSIKLSKSLTIPLLTAFCYLLQLHRVLLLFFYFTTIFLPPMI